MPISRWIAERAPKMPRLSTVIQVTLVGTAAFLAFKGGAEGKFPTFNFFTLLISAGAVKVVTDSKRYKIRRGVTAANLDSPALEEGYNPEIEPTPDQSTVTVSMKSNDNPDNPEINIELQRSGRKAETIFNGTTSEIIKNLSDEEGKKYGSGSDSSDEEVFGFRSDESSDEECGGFAREDSPNSQTQTDGSAAVQPMARNSNEATQDR